MSFSELRELTQDVKRNPVFTYYSGSIANVFARENLRFDLHLGSPLTPEKSKLGML